MRRRDQILRGTKLQDHARDRKSQSDLACRLLVDQLRTAIGRRLDTHRTMKSIRSAGRLVKEGARIRPVIATQAALCRVPVQPRCAVAGPSVRRYATAHEPVSIEAIPAIASDKTYDIVIIGGGNAGLALACALCECDNW